MHTYRTAWRLRTSNAFSVFLLLSDVHNQFFGAYWPSSGATRRSAVIEAQMRQRSFRRALSTRVLLALSAPGITGQMATLRAQARLLRAELVARRAAVAAGWSELEAKGESVRQAESAITEELTSVHKERLEQLARQLRREEDEAHRLEASNAALQAAVAADLRALLELLRLPFDSSSGAVSTGFARVERLDESKRLLRARLARQVEATRALLEEAELRAARAEAAARAERERELRLARGDRMLLWEPG
jgi:hypothetical protein